MSRYPRAARDAKIKCMRCNAPVTETVDGGYACVACGRNPVGDGGPGDARSGTDDEAPTRDGSPAGGRTGPRGDEAPGTTSVGGTSPKDAAPGRTSIADGETGVDG